MFVPLRFKLPACEISLQRFSYTAGLKQASEGQVEDWRGL